MSNEGKPYPTTMAQTRDFKETVAARVKSDPAFAQALLDEALTLFIGGDSDTAKLILSDLANAGCGLESLESIQNVEQAAKLKALRDAVAVGLASGPDIEAAEVFDRLEARLLAMAQNRE